MPSVLIESFVLNYFTCFFFSSRRRHTRSLRDWSSDVCSSDLIVGSGAAGGMAAHVLTTHGLQVLMLEAGKKLPIEQELRSMQWPYDHPRRGDAPPGSHHLSFNEYTIRKPPYAKGAAFKHVYSYV